MPTVELAHPRSSALKALLERGYLEQASDLEGIDAAFADSTVSFYQGYDPTAGSLHAGHLLTIMAMRLVQKHGHRPLCLVGGGTALVGDPSGKNETRKLLSREDVNEHAKAFRRQFGSFLHFDRGEEHDALLVNNADWLCGLSYIEFLRDIGRHFTVNRMVAAKTYRDRLEAELPLSFLEFNYQLLQAYDFHHLNREYNCTMQLGGSDQWGNMIAGVELIRRLAAHEGRAESDAKANVYCLTYPLLTTADGKKMGKTESGAVWLDPDRFKPFDYYQFWYNCADQDVEKLLRLYTDLPLEEVAELTSVQGAAINHAKTRLAYETTKLLHGEDEANAAKTASSQAFGAGEDWSAVPCVEIEAAQIKLGDLLVHQDIAAFKSKREARSRVESGAVKLDGTPCKDMNALVTPDMGSDKGLRLQTSKKRRFRVKLRG